jgi:colanic acid/amylovoran biosynthesis glycosyltransferase
MNHQDTGLTVLLNYQVKRLSDTQVLMVKKFLDEILKYSSLWPGKMRLLIEQDPQKSELIETVSVNPKELPFEFQIVSYPHLKPKLLFEKTSIVYTAVGRKHNKISQYCQSAGVPCVYISEYNLNSRQQIIDLNFKNILLRWRKKYWEINQEKKQVQGIKLASGIHCNGTPTYEEYKKINSNTLLYFDNRVADELLATPKEVAERTKYLCESNQPLRLAFSGRLIKMKGADQLIDVAQELRTIGVTFEMFICGDGNLKTMMESRILASGLANCVRMMGLLSFATQLLPFIKNKVDLFVCCHRQSDPSCTYLETMSCGVPIIGYANEAFAGVVKYSKVGWLIEMDRPKLIARKIAELNSNRNLIKDMSWKALEFAKKHSFEKTYEKRIEHLEKTSYQFKALMERNN